MALGALRWRRALALFALVCGGVLVALAIGETVARYGWRPTVRPPRFARVGPPVPHEMNRAGFRGPERPLPKSPGVYRIVLVGDSVVFGVGVRYEETYGALVEAGLNAAGGARRVEVLNLGQPGLNLEQIVARLERHALPYQPDLIVYGFTMNDVEGRAYRRTVTPALLKAQRERAGRFDHSPSALVRVLWRAWVTLPDALGLAHPTSYLYELQQNVEHNPAVWTEFVAHLERLATIGGERGVCVHVLIHTHLQQLTPNHVLLPYYDRVATAAEGYGLTVTQSFPFVVGLQEDALHVGLWDPHPNPEGHRRLARALLDGLQTLPPRCGLPRLAGPQAATQMRSS